MEEEMIIHETVVFFKLGMKYDERVREIDKVGDIFASYSHKLGRAIFVDEQGLYRLPGKIGRFKNSYAVLYRYLAEPEDRKEINKVLNTDPNIIAYLTTDVITSGTEILKKISPAGSKSEQAVSRKKVIDIFDLIFNINGGDE